MFLLHRNSLLSLVAIVLALSLVAAPAWAADDADPVKTFDDVFGESYRKAIGSSSTTDDVELAVDLAKAVTTIDMPPSLVRVIADRMMSLTEKAPGARVPTVKALDKLISVEKDEAKKLALEMEAIALLEKASESGDAAAKSIASIMLIDRVVPLADQLMTQRKVESAHTWYMKALKVARDISSSQTTAIVTKIAAAEVLLKDAREVDALEKRIEANPKDVEARKRLIEIHLVKRDDPSAAIWFASEGVDEKTKKLLPVAARDGDKADAPTLAQLADWYNDLAEAAAAADKAAMYKRAKNYYERFLTLHKDNDLLKAKATLTLGQIDRKLKELASGAATTTGTTPGTPGTIPAATTTTSDGPGALTVKIDGPSITDAERVERLYTQHSRHVAKPYFVMGSDYVPVFDFDSKYPSSNKETLAAVKARMTTTKIERVGLIKRMVTVPPVPAEAESIAMALPAITPGSYGYLHSMEVLQVLGEDEMIVKNFWMVDRDTLLNVPWDQRKERDELVRRQNDWNFGGNTMRLLGFPTTGLKPGERVGIGGKTGKPIQVYIVSTDPQDNVFKKTRPVATLTSNLLKGGIDEKQFADLLNKRSLTRTDFVNIYLEAQRTSLKDALSLAITRIEAKGVKSP